MVGRGPEQLRVFVPKGKDVRLVLEGGPLIDVKNPQSATTPFVLEQKSPDSREAQRERLKAEYAGILYPHVRARLNQHGYQVLGGEEAGGEMELLETGAKLRAWIESAKTSGISNGEVLGLSEELLKNVTIAAPRKGEISIMVKGIKRVITDTVDEVWGVGKKRPTRRI